MFLGFWEFNEFGSGDLFDLGFRIFVEQPQTHAYRHIFLGFGQLNYSSRLARHTALVA